MDKDEKIKELEEKNKRLEEELLNTKEHLKKYTAPPRSKTFYEKHREEILEKNKNDPKLKEQRKEYNKLAYQKRKEKLENNKNL